jgi:hypothetical protein
MLASGVLFTTRLNTNIKGESHRLREKKKAGLLGRQRRPADGAVEPEEVGADA